MSAEKLSPFLMQIVAAVAYVFFIPFAYKLAGPSPKWNTNSIILTSIATLISIGGNVLLYSGLKGNQNSGASAMLISLYPVITMMLSMFILNEQMTVTKILGVVAMIGGAILLSLK
jgi:drug/metabolite transporter (DMT)-like permease